MTVIIDYGVGNLFSLKSSFDAIGENTLISGDERIIKQADRLILPGVGAFRDAMAKLSFGGLDRTVKELAGEGCPIMGICLGMQLLFDKSLEYGEHCGLGLIRGEVRPIGEVIPKEYKVPHMGWNSLSITSPSERLFKYISNGDYVYFVHSYAAMDCDGVIATSDYGAPLTAAVAEKNILGCQFHPEKSGEVGLKLLRAFCEL